MARKFGLTPDQFGENLRDNYQRHETQQHPLEPEDTAENYLSRSVNVKSDTVKAIVSGHPRDAIKMSVTGPDRLREWFS